MSASARGSPARHLALALEAERARHADLHLRYWNQAAHYVVPASDARKVRAAIQDGTRPVLRLLGEIGLTAGDVAARIGLDAGIVEAELLAPVRSPVVVLDGEDSVTPDGMRRGSALAVASAAIRGFDWGADPGQGALRAYRIPRLADRGTCSLVASLLRSVADPGRPDAYPLDVVVYPKAEIPEEIDLLLELLDAAERGLNLPSGRIKVMLIAESAAAIARLDVLTSRAMPRLCGVVAGLVDYAADIGALAEPDHYAGVDWVRSNVVNAAASVGVPAIDGMTTAFPLRRLGSTAGESRRLFLDRVAFVYQAARAAFDLGMSGKWVGHPVQLFAVLLAWRAAMAPVVIESQVAVIRQYRDALAHGYGVLAIDGSMIDAASDRHARTRLRRAAATGLVDGLRALELGVIAAGESVPSADHFRPAASSTAAMQPGLVGPAVGDSTRPTSDRRRS